MTEGIEQLDTLKRRLEIVERLNDGPLHKPDLVESLHCSRSTVDRAVDELEAVGFVERVTRGYVTTQTGRLAAEQYRSFLENFDGLLGVSDVINTVPSEYELPLNLVSNATVETVEGPHELFTRVADHVRGVDSYRIVLPRLVDSRYVRIWHSHVVRGDRAVEVLTAPTVFERIGEEFPGFTDELADADGFTATVVDTPRVGLVLTPGADDGSTSEEQPSGERVLVIAYGEDGVAGVVRSDHPEAIAWATGLYEQLRGQGEPAAEKLQCEGASVYPLSGTRFPASLRSEGYVRIDEQFFEERQAIEPAAGWRAGLGLPEVADGQAVERRLEDGTSLVRSVTERLRENQDVVVLGPAGSGKSTLCKQIACEWADGEDRAVLYRQSGQGQPFTSARVLEDYLREVPESVLVVVEDAVRTEASRIFDVMDRFSGRDDVTFLLDSREGEWHDPDGASLDSRSDAFRREAVEPVSMPPLDRDDCRRLISSAESLLETRIEADPDDVLADVRDAEDTSIPGTMLLLIHRLSQLADPLAEYERGRSTALDDDVDSVRRDLADIGDAALDVGVLVNALNAADVEIHDELVYALAVGRSDADTQQVEAALDRLEGQVLFDRESTAGYRGIHGTWSVEYLDRHRDFEGEYATKRRFGRSLSTLLELADEPDRCTRLAQFVHGQTPVLDTVVADPATWAEELVVSLFEAGQTNARLAPLFGTSETPSVEIPSLCSDATVAQCVKLRGQMYAVAGEYDAAIEEFDRLAELGTGAASAEFETEARSLKATALRKQGKYDRAQDHFEQILDRAQATGNGDMECRALNGLGVIRLRRGAPEAAHECFQSALDIAEAIGDSHVKGDVLGNLGGAAWRMGDYEQACEYQRRELRLKRDLGDRSSAAKCLNNLGLLARKRDDYGRAREHFRESLAIRRETGDRRGEVSVLGGLGSLHFTKGEYDRARECYRNSIEIAEDIGDQQGAGSSYVGLAAAATRLGRHELARDCAEQSLAIARDLDLPRIEATGLCRLGQVSRAEGDYETARDRLDRALEIAAETDARERAVEIYLEKSRLALACETVDDAREHAVRARETAVELENQLLEMRARTQFGRVVARQGESSVACEEWQAALAAFEELDTPQYALATLDRLVETCRERGDEKQAREWCQKAREVLADAPTPVRERYSDQFDEAPAEAADSSGG